MRVPEIPTTYDSASDFLAGGRDGWRRKVANNTYMFRDSDAYDRFIVLRYHYTNIARIYRDVTVLNARGWWTRSTLDRLNVFTEPHHVRLGYRGGRPYAWNWDTRITTELTHDAIFRVYPSTGVIADDLYGSYNLNAREVAS